MRRNQHGQALVEFSLVLPIFLLLLLGLLEGGRLIFANNTVSQAAREGARLAAVEAAYIAPAACTAPTSVCSASTAAFWTNVLQAANQMTVVVGAVPSQVPPNPVPSPPSAGLYITCTAPGAAPTGSWVGVSTNDCASANISGNVVSVLVVVQIHPMTPILGPVYPATLSAASTMAIP